MKPLSLCRIVLCALAVCGCAGRQDMGWSGDVQAPRIAGIRVALSALSVGEEDAEAVADFVLLKVSVDNPDPAEVTGVIACQQETSEDPLESPFDIDPRTRDEYTLPLEEARPVAFGVRCRLQFSADAYGWVRAPSPWVRVQVPARQPG